MKISMFACALAAVSIAMMVTKSAAQATSPLDESPWVVYRGSDGKFSHESMRIAGKMLRKAARDGYITLWLLPQRASTSETGQMSETQYGLRCVRILQPLVDRQIVWHPTAGPSNSGPVCLVRASTAGVAMLLREDRLEQIMGAHDSHSSHSAH